MKRIYKIILVTTLIIIITLGLAYLLFFKSIGEVNVPSMLNEAVISFPEINETVHFRAKAWGIGGNHEEIIISTSPIDKERKSIKGVDFIFYTSEIYYKKQGTDTLLVYAESSSIAKLPESLTTKVKIIPMELKTYNEVKDYAKNYQDYGLSKLSVFKK